MSREEVENLRDLAEETDDLDTNTLDAFRAAATPSFVHELATDWLRKQEALQRIVDYPAMSGDHIPYELNQIATVALEEPE